MNFNMTILGQSISFILFVLFCMKYVWSPLILIIEKRQKIIADDLEAAKCNKLESDRLYKQAKKNLVNSQIKSQEIIKKANVYKTKILSEAIKEANQKKDQILLKAEEQIIYERKRVFDEIKNEIFQLVILSTEKIIKNYMTNAIDQKIVNDVVNAIDLNKE